MILCSYHMLVLVEKEKQPCLFCLSRRYLFSSRFQLLPITGLHFYFKIALSFPLLKLTYPPPPPPPTTFELSPSVAVLPTPTSVGHKGRFGSEFLLLHLPPPPKSALLLRHLSLSLAPAPSRNEINKRGETMDGYIKRLDGELAQYKDQINNQEACWSFIIKGNMVEFHY
ncbi:hypothetical protein L2E82_04349 [Cichorium intybus]|uniref:Uncharacterized protein n=1 Tax=Cichorium intybus TaxID=13427 RepID=A0ACB9H656_CICIN|nr:hypothetical protein L2E82_04349 [Cichorium intybus]